MTLVSDPWEQPSSCDDPALLRIDGSVVAHARRASLHERQMTAGSDLWMAGYMAPLLDTAGCKC